MNSSIGVFHVSLFCAYSICRNLQLCAKEDCRSLLTSNSDVHVESDVGLTRTHLAHDYLKAEDRTVSVSQSCNHDLPPAHDYHNCRCPYLDDVQEVAKVRVEHFPKLLDALRSLLSEHFH